jgi:hypothetical protein
MNRSVRDLHLLRRVLSKREKTANVFTACFAGLEMYFDYLPLSLVEIVVSDSDELVKINVVVLKPEFWRQREREAARRDKPTKLSGELVVTSLTLGHMLANT